MRSRSVVNVSPLCCCSEWLVEALYSRCAERNPALDACHLSAAYHLDGTAARHLNSEPNKMYLWTMKIKDIRLRVPGSGLFYLFLDWLNTLPSAAQL